MAACGTAPEIPDMATEPPGLLDRAPAPHHRPSHRPRRARIAVARLQGPTFAPGIGPSGKSEPVEDRRGRLYPLWLWPDGPTQVGPVSDSVAGLRVSLTAKVSEISFRMGDGNTVTCPAESKRWTNAVQPGQKSPTCGYAYAEPSLPKGNYTIAAVTTWDVTWTVNNQSGVIRVPAVQTAQLPVGELPSARPIIRTSRSMCSGSAIDTRHGSRCGIRSSPGSTRTTRRRRRRQGCDHVRSRRRSRDARLGSPARVAPARSGHDAGDGSRALGRVARSPGLNGLLQVARQRSLPASLGDPLVSLEDLELDREMPGLGIGAERRPGLVPRGDVVPSELQRGARVATRVPAHATERGSLPSSGPSSRRAPPVREHRRGRSRRLALAPARPPGSPRGPARGATPRGRPG